MTLSKADKTPGEAYDQFMQDNKSKPMEIRKMPHKPGEESMTKLDEIEPTGHEEKYKVELQVEGEWVAMALLSKEAIKLLADYMCSDKLGDMEEQ